MNRDPFRDRHAVQAGILVACLLQGACAYLPEPDPARSEAMARSAADAATAPVYEPAETPRTRPRPPGVAEAVDAAVANEARPLADRLRDANRRPAEILKFFGIRPGMKVLDLWSGGGYYTEILSYLVGPEGTVVAHNNGTYLDFTRTELATRYAAGRLPNVTRLLAENNELTLPAGEFDAVIMTNVYHDIYFEDEKIGWQRVDGPRLLAGIQQALKPGGVLGIVDHAAAPGSGPEAGGTLHRIDPERVRQDLLTAGFVLEAESDILRNPADDRSRVVFDPTIQGRTDQFAFRFRKPR